MSEKEQIVQLQQELRKVRALLPELLQRLSTIDEKQNGRTVFYDIARGVGDWYIESEKFLKKFEELKPVMDRLRGANINTVEPLEVPDVIKNDIPTENDFLEPDKFDYELGGLDGFTQNFMDLT